VAWFDWNGDGEFGPGEMINFGELLEGDHNLLLTIPNGYTTGAQLNVRFRLYETEPTDPQPTGLVMGGEVEDYRWSFSPTAVTLITITASTPASTGLLVAMLPLIMALFGATVVWQRRSALVVG
jgi:hypothetical protein